MNGTAYSECTQYNKFKERFYDLRRTNSQLNVTIWKGQKHVPHIPDSSKELQMVYFRSAIISILATWEAYVQDLFEEVKDIVVDSIKARKTTRMHLVERAIEITNDGDGKKKQREELVVQCMKLIENPDDWMTQLDTYMKFKLGNAIHIIPVFSGDRGIDKKFQSLFEIKGVSLSKEIMSRPLSHFFFVRGNEQKQLTLKTADDLDLLIRLYYGARCVFAHGQPGHTFGNGGVLEDFPTTIGDLVGNVGDVDVATRLFEFHANLKQHGMKAWVYYPVVVNLQRFIFYLGQRLFRAISKCVYDEFQLRIWMYDPSNPVEGDEKAFEMDDTAPDLAGLFPED